MTSPLPRSPFSHPVAARGEVQVQQPFPFLLFSLTLVAPLILSIALGDAHAQIRYGAGDTTQAWTTVYLYVPLLLGYYLAVGAWMNSRRLDAWSITLLMGSTVVVVAAGSYFGFTHNL